MAGQRTRASGILSKVRVQFGTVLYFQFKSHLFSQRVCRPTPHPRPPQKRPGGPQGNLHFKTTGAEHPGGAVVCPLPGLHTLAAKAESAVWAATGSSFAWGWGSQEQKLSAAFSLGEDPEVSRACRWRVEGSRKCPVLCLFVCLLFIFEMGLYSAALAGLELTEIRLPLLSECWD